MPPFGNPSAAQDGNVGLGMVPIANKSGMNEYAREFRDKNRVNIPEQPEPIRERSDELQVYIFSVGPRPFYEPMGSMGTFTIPALTEDKVFHEDHYVAGPLIIPGLPMEHYPAEQSARELYHQPSKMSSDFRRPGLNFAIEILGGGRMAMPHSDLRKWGCFVSEQPQQQKPSDAKDAKANRAWKQWMTDVLTAEDLLRKKLVETCENASIEHSRGKFADVRNDELYMYARLLRATPLQYRWLEGSSAEMDNKACWSCGTTIKKSLKCPNCGELQVTAAEFEEEKQRRAGMHA